MECYNLLSCLFNFMRELYVICLIPACIHKIVNLLFYLYMYVFVCLFSFLFLCFFSFFFLLLLCFCICFLSIPNLVELLELFNCRHMFKPLSLNSLFFIFEYLVFPPHTNLSNLSPTFVSLFVCLFVCFFIVLYSSFLYVLS